MKEWEIIILLVFTVVSTCIDNSRAETLTNGVYNYTLVSSENRRTFWDHVESSRLQNAWPITFETEGELDLIELWLSELGMVSTQMWIGLTSYRRDNFEYLDGSHGPITTHWGEGEPSDRQFNRCALFIEGLFITKNCGESLYELSIYKAYADGRPAPTQSTPSELGPCPMGYQPFESEKSRCFKMVTLGVSSGMTYDEAEGVCQNDEPGAVLSTITYVQRLQILSMMNEKVSGYWIGLHKQQTGSGVWIDNSPAPSYVSGAWNQKCGAIAYTQAEPGSLTYDNCETKKGYICQTMTLPSGSLVPTPAPSRQCDAYPGFLPHADSCYKLLKTKLSWPVSETKCKELGAHLVAIHSTPENAFIQMMAQTAGVPVWIGLYKPSGYREKFRWSSGEMTTFWNYYASRIPFDINPYWMYMDRITGKWVETKDTTSYMSVCEITLGDPVVVPTPSDTFCPFEFNWETKKETIWSDIGDQCYNVTNSGDRWNDLAFTWLEAMEKCTERHHQAYLATIHNHATLVYLVDSYLEMSKNYNPGETGMWIGLFKNKKGEWLWQDGSPLDYTNWKGGHPDPTADDTGCVYVHADKDMKYEWEDISCDKKKNYICMVNKESHPESNGDGWCPHLEDHDLETYSDNCYIFYSNKEVSQKRASEVCSNIPGVKASLVSIKSPEENIYVRTLLHKDNLHQFHRDFWIGLTITTGDGVIEYNWEDGTAYDYHNFYPGEPVLLEHGVQCVAMDTSSGLWFTRPCTEVKGFTCKAPAHKQNQEALLYILGEWGGFPTFCLALVFSSIVLVIGGVLFFGGVKLLKKKNVKLPMVSVGFENSLYGLVD